MKKLSREMELEILAQTRKLVHNKAAAKEVAMWFDKFMSESDKLALKGANWEALGRMPAAIPGAERQLRTEMDPDLLAMLIAGAVRCITTSCSHVRTEFGIVRYVFLAPRVCVCAPCIPSFAKQFMEHDAKNEHTGECDLCLSQGIGVFHPITGTYNGAIYYGDACPACKALLITD